MAPRPMAIAPDHSNIPHSHRLPVGHRDVQRTLHKLSRQSLVSLAHQWLSRKNREFCRPLLSDRDGDGEAPVDGDEAYEPAQTIEEVQEVYKQLSARKGGKQEVLDRILSGDWRAGISMYQLATAEIQYLLDHPNTLRWTAKRLTKMPNTRSLAHDMEVTNDSDNLPRFQAQTFMANLSRELTPLIKAHYLITRIKTIPLTILRVYIHDSPYSTEASLAADNNADSAKAVFFIWPNSSPFVYSSLATHLGQTVGDDGRHLRELVQQAIPKAFSRPSSRYQLASTNFTTKSLDALLTYRGPGKSNAATGGWSIFQDHSFSQNALDFITTRKIGAVERKILDDNGFSRVSNSDCASSKYMIEETEISEVKWRKEVAQGRFGSFGRPDDGQGLDKFEVRLDDPFLTVSFSHPQESEISKSNAYSTNSKSRGRPSVLDRTLNDLEEIEDIDAWIPDVRVTFSGSHVFAGIRHLVEEGIVDGRRMPGWMTGATGVTIGAVKNGRIKETESVVSSI